MEDSASSGADQPFGMPRAQNHTNGAASNADPSRDMPQQHRRDGHMDRQQTSMISLTSTFSQTRQTQASLETEPTAAELFFIHLGQIAQLRDQYPNEPTNVFLAICRLHYFSSAGRIVWKRTTPSTRQKLSWNWDLQESLCQTEATRTLLSGAHALLTQEHGVEDLPDDLAALWEEEGAANPGHLKYQMFEVIMNNAKLGLYAIEPIEKWQDDIMSVMSDPAGHPDDTIDVMCLTRLMFPSMPFITGVLINYTTLLEDIEEQFTQDGLFKSVSPQARELHCLPVYGFPQTHYKNGEGVQRLPATTTRKKGALRRNKAKRIPLTSKQDNKGPVASSNALPPNTAVATPAGPTATHPAPIAGLIIPALHPNGLAGDVNLYHARHTKREKPQWGASAADQQRDTAEVKHDEQRYQKELFDACVLPPVNPSTAEAAGMKSFEAGIDLLDQSIDKAGYILGVVSQTLDVCINLYEHGSTLWSHETNKVKIPKADGGEEAELEDRTCGIKERIENIKVAYRQQKLIALDCLMEDRKIPRVVRFPASWALMKTHHEKNNTRRAISKQKDNVKLGKPKIRSRGGAGTEELKQVDEDGDENGDSDEDGETAS